MAVVYRQAFPGSVRLEMQIRAWTSLARLTFCAGAANVPLAIWSAAGGDADSAEPQHLRFQITAPTQPLDEGWVSAFGILAIRLARDLHRASALPASRANCMLDAWGGQAV